MSIALTWLTLSRYLHVRILALRPVLLTIVTSATLSDNATDSSSLVQQVTLQTALLCVRLAEQAIDVIYDRLSNTTRLELSMSEWWYNIMYIYNAGTVIIAARILPAISNEISATTLERTWRKARLVLQSYQTYGNNTNRLLVILDQLYERVNEAREGQGQTQSTFANSGEQSATEEALEGSRTESSTQPSVSAMEDTASSAASPDMDEVFSSINAMDLNFNWNDMSWLQHGVVDVDDPQHEPR